MSTRRTCVGSYSCSLNSWGDWTSNLDLDRGRGDLRDARWNRASILRGAYPGRPRGIPRWMGSAEASDQRGNTSGSPAPEMSERGEDLSPASDLFATSSRDQ